MGEATGSENKTSKNSVYSWNRCKKKPPHPSDKKDSCQTRGKNTRFRPDFGRVAQLVRAQHSHCWGHRFESCRDHHLFLNRNFMLAVFLFYSSVFLWHRKNLPRKQESGMLARGRVPYDKYRRTPSDPEGSSGSQVPWVLWSTRLFFIFTSLQTLTFQLNLSSFSCTSL